MKRVLSDMYFLGRKCIFCDKYGLYRLKNKRVKCKHCKKYYSLRKLKREMEILYYFYLEVSARKTAKELKFNYRLVHRKFMQFRKRIIYFTTHKDNAAIKRLKTSNIIRINN